MELTILTGWWKEMGYYGTKTVWFCHLTLLTKKQWYMSSITHLWEDTLVCSELTRELPPIFIGSAWKKIFRIIFGVVTLVNGIRVTHWPLLGCCSHCQYLTVFGKMFRWTSLMDFRCPMGSLLFLWWWTGCLNMGTSSPWSILTRQKQ